MDIFSYQTKIATNHSKMNELTKQTIVSPNRGGSLIKSQVKKENVKRRNPLRATEVKQLPSLETGRR